MALSSPQVMGEDRRAYKRASDCHGRGMEKRALGWARKQENRTVSLAAVCLEAGRSGNLDLG